MAGLSLCMTVLVAVLFAFIGTVDATVQAVVIFARTGERTPIVGPDEVRLTSTGAQQAYSLVRSRLGLQCLLANTLDHALFFSE